jgi:hypothetical protein
MYMTRRRWPQAVTNGRVTIVTVTVIRKAGKLGRARMNFGLNSRRSAI